MSDQNWLRRKRTGRFWRSSSQSRKQPNREILPWQDELFYDRAPDCGRGRSTRVIPGESDQAPGNLCPLSSQDVLEFALIEPVVEELAVTNLVEEKLALADRVAEELALEDQIVRELTRIETKDLQKFYIGTFVNEPGDDSRSN